MAKQNLPSIHISDIRLFRTCREKWNQFSPLKNNLEPKIQTSDLSSRSLALHDGTLFHTMFELVHRDGAIPNNETFWKAFRHMNEHLDQDTFADLQLASLHLWKIIKAYYRHWQAQKEQWSDDKFKFFKLEEKFEFLAPKFLLENQGHKTPFTFGGRIDGIIQRHDDKSFWLWENKTSGRPTDLKKSLWNDNQSGLYLWIAGKLFNLPIKGIVYNIVKKEIPKTPEELKNGTLSQAKSINTVATAYYDYAVDFHGKPDAKVPMTPQEVKEHYRGILTHLAANPDQDFFTRIEITKTPEQLEQLVWNLGYTAKEMLSPFTAIYPNESPMNCNWCSAKSICARHGQGLDADDIIEKYFQQKRKYEAASED